MGDKTLKRKCSHTLKSLFFYSRNKLRDLSKIKVELEQRVLQLQEVETSSMGLLAEQEDILRHAILELNSIVARLNTWRRQQAKVRCLHEGDENTRFFHTITYVRHCHNWIGSFFTTEWETSKDPRVVEAKFIYFF